MEKLVQELAEPHQALVNDLSTGIQYGEIPDAGDSMISGLPSDQLTENGVNGDLPSSGAGNGLVYNGDTHWSAMLQDIDELRSVMLPASPDITMEQSWGNVFEDHSAASSHDACSILFGAAIPFPDNQVFTELLPNRQETDRLVATYFRAQAVRAPFLHAALFQKQYAEFWKDPKETSPMWASILFSICHISSDILNQDEQSSIERLRSNYSVTAARCLVLGQYYRAQPLTVEALILFAQAQCLCSLNMPPDIPLLMSSAIRMAMVMGYHRDPEKLRISAYDKEMRRRTWSICLQMDLLVSFHLGLPSNVQRSNWNTKMPLNLLDADLDDSPDWVPKPQSDDKQTQLSFYLAKHRFMVIFEKILQHVLSDDVTDESLVRVDGLQAELSQIWASVPPALQTRSMTESVVDSPNDIVTRLCLYFLYCKCLVVLHRPYVVTNCLESIKICYNAASGLVEAFVDASKEFQVGGQVSPERWFMSSITWHDFLTCSMALCLVLTVHCRRSLSSPAVTEFVDIEASLSLLRRARDICAAHSASRARETMQVIRILSTVTAKFSEYAHLSDEPLYPAEAEFWNEASSPTTLLDDTAWAYLDQYMNCGEQFS